MSFIPFQVQTAHLLFGPFVDQRFGINIGGHFFSMLYTSAINGMSFAVEMKMELGF